MKTIKKKSSFLYYQCLLSIASIAIFFTGLVRYIYLVKIISLPPLIYIGAFCLAAISLLLIKNQINTHTKYLMIWCSAFVLISVLAFLLSSQSSIAFQALEDRVVMGIFIFSLVVIFSQNSLVQKCALWTILFSVLLSVTNNVYELFYPEAFYWEDVGRSAGFYIDPNNSSGMIALGMLFSVELLKPRYRIPFVLLAGIGVFVTFSRSGILSWLVLSLILTKSNIIPQLKLFKIFIITLVLTVLLSSQLNFIFNSFQVDTSDFLHTKAQQRVEMFTTGDTEDSSAEERFELVQLSLDLFGEKPLLGHGIGITREWEFKNTHNMYLVLLVEYGITGAFIIPSFLYAINRNTIPSKHFLNLGFAVFILLWCFFSHRVLYNRPILVLASFLAVSNKKENLKCISL